jgi:hypothetical protein
MLRDELQAIDDPSAVRLATQIDVAATMLLAAPLHAGVRAVRVADDERQVLLDVSRKLEYVPGGQLRQAGARTLDRRVRRSWPPAGFESSFASVRRGLDATSTLRNPRAGTLRPLARLPDVPARPGWVAPLWRARRPLLR